MWKSVIYKEWLKIRWFLIGFTALGIIGVGYIFLKVQHDITFMEGKNYWYSILFQNLQYFAYLKFLPLAGGLIIGIAQYFPETVNKRIKLAFHLPVRENKMMMIMVLFGAGSLLVSFLLLFVLFVLLSGIFFPSGIILGAITSVLPWFCAGLAAYFFVALVILEPVWKYRFLYSLVGVFFISLFLKTSVTGGYGPVNPVLAVLCLLLSFGVLFPAYRFRKGEM